MVQKSARHSTDGPSGWLKLSITRAKMRPWHHRLRIKKGDAALFDKIVKWQFDDLDWQLIAKELGCSPKTQQVCRYNLEMVFRSCLLGAYDINAEEPSKRGVRLRTVVHDTRSILST